MSKKLTVAELIKRQEEFIRKKEEVKTLDLYIEELDAEITITNIEDSLAMEANSLGEDFKHSRDEYVLYNIMKEPNLKDAELQKAYNCAEPLDIVTKILSLNTVSKIVIKAMEFSGFNSKVTIVDKVKNA